MILLSLGQKPRLYFYVKNLKKNFKKSVDLYISR